jgi:hypothetical protein
MVVAVYFECSSPFDLRNETLWSHYIIMSWLVCIGYPTRSVWQIKSVFWCSSALFVLSGSSASKITFTRTRCNKHDGFYCTNSCRKRWQLSINWDHVTVARCLIPRADQLIRKPMPCHAMPCHAMCFENTAFWLWTAELIFAYFSYTV